MSIIIIGVFIIGSIDNIHITALVYGDEDKGNQGDKLSKEIFVNESMVPARVERVILYSPYVLTSGEGLKYVVENETVILSGFVQSNTGLRGNSVYLYDVSNDMNKDNLLGTYVFDDPVSTQFLFKVNITQQLVKASSNSGNQLQFRVYYGNISSNTVTANTLVNRDKASKYQYRFEPQEYDIPEKIILSSTFPGKLSNAFAYLTRYELVDKNTGNVQVFTNTEDNVDRFDTRTDYNWNLTSGKSIVSLKFENSNPTPIFVDMFLKQFEYHETSNHEIDNNSIPVLYRFVSLKDEKMIFKTPLVREGIYTIEINVFLDNKIRASYVLSKIGAWFT